MEVLHGIDIVSVRRMECAMRSGGSRFSSRIFTPAETAYCQPMRMRYEHYAARFAAKEAFIKAAKVIRNAPDLKEIEVRRRPSGKPYIYLSPAARRKVVLPRGSRIELALSHERSYAMASVIIVIPGNKTRSTKHEI